MIFSTKRNKQFKFLGFSHSLATHATLESVKVVEAKKVRAISMG